MSEARSRVQHFLDIVDDDPDAVDLSTLRTLLEHDDETIRRLAMEGLFSLAQHRPDTAIEFLPTLIDRLDDEHPRIRNWSAVIMRELADDHLSEMESTIEPLVDRLGDESRLVANNALRMVMTLIHEYPQQVATGITPERDRLLELLEDPTVAASSVFFVFHEIAQEHPDQLTNLIPTMIEAMECGYRPDRSLEPESVSPDDVIGSYDVIEEEYLEETLEQHERKQTVTEEFVRESGAFVLVEIAEETPEPLVEVMDDLLPFLQDHNPSVQGAVIDIVRLVADVSVETVAPATETLVTVYTEPDEILPEMRTHVRGKAAHALASIAEADSGVITDDMLEAVPQLIEDLDSEEPPLRGAAVGLLTYVAEEAPQEVEQTTPLLIELLEDDRDYVRGNAALCLGLLGAQSALEDLEAMAESDPDEGARQMASNAVELIEQG